jgi:hypothetical protein
MDGGLLMGAKDVFFEALGGETPVGFFTHSTSLGTGVDVTGNQLGVKGTCGGPDPGDGVQGFGSGSASGVKGVGGSVTSGAGGTGVSGSGGPSDSGTGGTGLLGFGGNATFGTAGAGVLGFGGNVSESLGGGGAPGVVGNGGSGGADGVQGFAGGGNFSGVTGVGGSNNGSGVSGFGGGTTGPGVSGVGSGPNTDGVLGFGRGSGGAGVHGFSSELDGNGVLADASNGGGAFAVWARSSSGFAGFFEGKVNINGDLHVTGAKVAVVPFPDGTSRVLYCIESPESWFEDFGIGHLVNGQAEVQLAADFASVVNSESYHVFVTEYEDNNALYVTKRTSTGFAVRAKSSKTAGGTFSYRVVAKRKDIAGPRFEKVTIPAEKLRAAPTLPLPPPKPARPTQ